MGDVVPMLQNVMEEIARDALQEFFARGYTGCTCEVCADDILALALNKLPPQYSASRTGETYVRARLFADQWRVDILRELTTAAAVVKQRRHHE